MEIYTLNTFLDLLLVYKNLILWIGSISLFIFVFSLISLKWLVVLIPVDYFLIKKKYKFKYNNPYLWYLFAVFKKIIGYTLILGGIMMLVLPGQGVFTIIIGLMLSNYPGKYVIEKKFIAIPAILKSINWLRAKSNAPPLKIN